MTHSLRAKAFGCAAALGAALSLPATPAWAGGRLEAPAAQHERPDAPTGPAAGQIVYTGLDGNVYTVDPATGESVAITSTAEGGRREYQLATWNPDGTTLAFVEVTSEGGSISGSRILVAPASRGSSAARAVHEVSGTSPVYLSWSPDGGRLGFLESPSGETGALELLTVLAVRGTVERISSGRSLYWDWSSDGSRIVTHAGTADDRGTLVETSLATHEWLGREATASPLATSPSGFQSPDFTASGRTFVMAGYPSDDARRERDAHLLLVSTTGDVVRDLVGVGGTAAFQLSSAEDRLAFIDGRASPYGGIMGSLGLMLLDDGEGTEPRLTALTEAEDVVAFFWSPDGSSLAYFRPQATGGGRGRTLTLEASVMNAATGESRQVAVFQPATPFMSQLIPFFDQYQRSATIWSPAGDAFVVNAVASGRPAVAVVPIAPDAKPLIVAYGNLPFWSPR